MKKVIFGLLAIVLLSNFSFSQSTDKKEFHIYWGDGEFGRTSKNCKGIGLCNYVDCWFCCTENDVIVDCKSKKNIPNSGVVIIDNATKKGFLTVKLDPNNPSHLEAINNKSIFYIDVDLKGANFTLKKGEYKFNSNIGKNGGYIVDVFVE
jgi:hypothetical protein